MWALIEERLMDHFKHAPGVEDRLTSLEAEVRSGTVTPREAAEDLLNRFAGDALPD